MSREFEVNDKVICIRNPETFKPVNVDGEEKFDLHKKVGKVLSVKKDQDFPILVAFEGTDSEQLFFKEDGRLWTVEEPSLFHLDEVEKEELGPVVTLGEGLPEIASAFDVKDQQTTEAIESLRKELEQTDTDAKIDLEAFEQDLVIAIQKRVPLSYIEYLWKRIQDL